MSRAIALAALLALAPPAHAAPACAPLAAAAATLYVSPLGRDGWSGRLREPAADGSDGPLASLEAARDRARTLDGPVAVHLRGGDYVLAAAVAFDSRDRGLALVAEPGEHPVLHGGPRLTGFAADPAGGLSAPLVLPQGTSVGSLFAADEKLVPARYPDAGADPRAGWLFADAFAPELGEWDGNLAFRFRRGDIPLLDDLTGVAAHIVGGFKPGLQWGNDTLPVTAIERDRRVVRTLGTAYFFTGPGSRYFLTGAPAFLDAPGEWRHDPATGRVRVLPGARDLAATPVHAGILPTFLLLHDADGMTLSGLTFAHGAPDGTGKLGTDMRGFGAVRLEGADGVRLAGNRFDNVGVAIHVSESDDVEITGNVIEHTAGNAIYLGTAWGTYAKSNRGRIVGNVIRDVGEVYYESAGVWFQGADDALIAHNLIERTAQFAIHGGSFWGETDASYRDVIEFNDIRDANQATADGGAIKLMGQQGDPQGHVVRHNRISGTAQLMNEPDGSFWPTRAEEIGKWPSPISWAIYTDGKASGNTITGNVLEGNVAGIGINGGWSNVVTGNVVEGGSGAAFRFDDGTGYGWHPEWAAANRFEGNLVTLSPEAELAAHVWSPGNGAGTVSFGHNVYAGSTAAPGWSFAPPLPTGGEGDLAAVAAGGQEHGSVALPAQRLTARDAAEALVPAAAVADLVPDFAPIRLAEIGPGGAACD